MSTRSHDRQVFYKYTSLETAHRVILSKSFRWSAPTLFNDPFDHQTGFVLTEPPDIFAALLFDSTERLIFSDHDPSPNPDSKYFVMAMQLRRMRHRLPREKILSDLRESCMKVALNLQNNLHELNGTLKTQLCRSRVLCVSETQDNVVMWSHYANKHRGAVFTLGCIDELDNRLLAARRVEYTDRFLTFPSAEHYARHLTGEMPFDITPLVWQIAFTKHVDWAYEREWRVHLPLLDPLATEGHLILDEPQEVFVAVCLGCRASDADVAATIDLTKQHLPRMKVFRARQGTQAFGLTFEEQNTG